jgi:UDP-3-O-[3-hydroxymyristoyl] N-acetylglucosamine deacetylase/3-hydroxyacyl-[acyl-carrier-protein] dehydratase
VAEQRTLAATVQIRGVGLHSGREVEVEIGPGEPGTGVVFIRSDLPGEPRVDALPENHIPKPRRTALVKGSAEVETPEHLLAALCGAGVHNAAIRLDGPELPGLDGSALPYYEAIRDAGVRGQGLECPEVRVCQPVAVSEGNASLVGMPRDQGFSIGYTLDYSQLERSAGFPSTQFLQIEVNEESFAREIAPARTFVFEEEIEQLRAEGLGKGANAKNTLVIGKRGVIDNELRFKDELVRHKILDLIGDLYLTRSRLHGHFVATRSGHALNLKLARLLRDSQGRGGASRGAPGVPAPKGEWSSREILEIIPHRYPFLLVDKVLEIDDGRSGVGVKNVTINEPFFQGHFPGRPVMPGVLIVEAMAQLAGLVMRSRKGTGVRIVILISLDNVKFRKMVEPGDQLILEANVKKVRSSIAQVATRALVCGVVVAEADVCFRMLQEDREPARS